MKIVSLLPSATEMVFALGLGDRLEGVSFECDFPEEARSKAVVSRSALGVDRDASQSEIDAAVSGSMSEAQPLYRIDRDLIRSIQPDLILAQDLCRVCAVPSGQVTEALDSLGCRAEVLSLDPHGVDEVIGGIVRLAQAAGHEQRGRALAASLRDRVAAVRRRAEGLEAVPTLALEWADPPFCGGHWVPEMVSLAGGREVLGVAGDESRRISWGRVAEAAPEVIVYMPCGYYLDDAFEQARGLYDVSEFAGTPAARAGRVFATDASAYFSRPGPRIVEGIEILAWALHPDHFPTPERGIARVGSPAGREGAERSAGSIEGGPE